METNTRQYESYQQSFHSATQYFGEVGNCIFVMITGFFLASTIINLLAQSAFAVYLISENPNVYPWFWKRVFDNIDYFNTPYMIGVALLQCAIVFVTCITIDMLYKRLQKLIEFRHR